MKFPRSLFISSIPQKRLLSSSSGTGLLCCFLDETRLFDLASYLLACELGLLYERLITVYYDSDSDLCLILLLFWLFLPMLLFVLLPIVLILFYEWSMLPAPPANLDCRGTAGLIVGFLEFREATDLEAEAYEWITYDLLTLRLVCFYKRLMVWVSEYSYIPLYYSPKDVSVWRYALAIG